MKQTAVYRTMGGGRVPRRGVAIIWALVTTSLVAILATLIASRVLGGRRHIDRRQHQLQAVWLARAGCELAAARLLGNPAYVGEVIELIPGARVRIEVRKDGNGSETLWVKAEARFPHTGPEMVKRTLEQRLRRIAEQDRVRLEILPPHP